MSNNLIYYSTNTRLAYIINQKFYSAKHFVWCAPVFNPEKLDDYDYRKKIPVSSSPYKIYKNLLDDVTTEDHHSVKIDQNRIGLKKGAVKMFERGVIDENDLARILYIIDKSSFKDFSPIIYLIPAEIVKDKIKSVEIEHVANPLSSEFQIEELMEDEFEIIEI